MVNLGQDGLATFRIYRPDARRVELQGDFTGWGSAPVPMLSDGHGWWTTERPIPAGVYEFHYLVDGHEWIADYAASGVRRNAFGLWVSLLRVPQVVVRRPAGAAAA